MQPCSLVVTQIGCYLVILSGVVPTLMEPRYPDDCLPSVHVNKPDYSADCYAAWYYITK